MDLQMYQVGQRVMIEGRSDYAIGTILKLEPSTVEVQFPGELVPWRVHISRLVSRED